MKVLIKSPWGVGRVHQGVVRLFARERLRRGRPRGAAVPARRGGEPDEGRGFERGDARGLAAAPGDVRPDGGARDSRQHMNGVRAGPCGHRSGLGRQERAFRDAAGPGGPRGVGRQGAERVVAPPRRDGALDEGRHSLLMMIRTRICYPAHFRLEKLHGRRTNDLSTSSPNYFDDRDSRLLRAAFQQLHLRERLPIH